MALKTEQNTPEMGDRVLTAFKKWDSLDTHQNPKSFYEHGQWYIDCPTCGAQWSVVDAEGRSAVDGFDFEQVSDGDGYCEERDSELDEEEPEEEEFDEEDEDEEDEDEEDEDE